MSPLSTGVLVTFLAIALLSFLVPFFSERIANKLKFRVEKSDLKGAAAVLLPSLVLLGGALASGSLTWPAIVFFAAAFFIPWLLTRLGLTPGLVGVVVWMGSVLMTMNIDKGASASFECAVAGLLLWKLSENLFSRPSAVVEDVLPALLWLGGLYWINAAGPDSALTVRQGLLLGAIEVGLLMKLLQGPFLGDDKLYVKRLVLSATAGLLLLIYITKLVVAPQMELLAAIFAGGVLLTYLIEEADRRTESGLSAHHVVKILILIGIFTVLASRLYGTFGWVILSPVALTATRPGAAAAAGMFWISRVVLQGYLVLYNPNVTGINITHAYAGAALYGGMLLAVLLSLFLRDVSDRKVSLCVATAAALVLPAASDYFLHAEATSSLLAAMTVGTILMAVVAPALYRQEAAPQSNLLVFPTLMVMVASLASPLIDMGNTSTLASRVNILAYLAAAVFAALVFAMWKSGRSAAKPVEVAGD